MKEKRILTFDKDKWKEILSKPVNTLQLFVTNRCNMKCKGCFYKHKIGKNEMSIDEYLEKVEDYEDEVDKVIVLGGEPTLHKSLNDMIKINTEKDLRTTIYTNGANWDVFKDADLSKTKIRLGVFGNEGSEKPLAKVKDTDLPLTIVYMLRKDNVNELEKTVEMSEKRFNCDEFYISSIRDIHTTGDFWKDTDDTLTPWEYYDIVQDFVDKYDGGMKKLHIADRGVINTENSKEYTSKCRFGNIFPDEKKVVCPFDISKEKYEDKLVYNKRNCSKHERCILQKVVLERIH